MLLSGLITAIVFWGVTPLQSALFITSTVDETTFIKGSLQGNLTLIQHGASNLNLSYLLQAYEVVWLNQSLPSFTTRDAAFMPFTIDQPADLSESHSTIEGQTSMLSTNLQCTSGMVKNRSFTLPESGCAVPFTALPESQYDLNFQYIGWESGPRSGEVEPLKTFNCSLASQNLYLAALATRNFSRTAGVFCQPNYWIQNVSLVVASSDMSYLSHTALSPPR